MSTTYQVIASEERQMQRGKICYRKNNDSVFNEDIRSKRSSCHHWLKRSCVAIDHKVLLFMDNTKSQAKILN